MSTEESPIEEKKTTTTKFAEWLIATLVTVAGATVADYVLMAWLWI